MDITRSTEIKVGVVSIAAIALLVLGIMMGQGFSFSPNRQLVKIRLDVSGGLEPGSPIVVNGVKRGKVDRVENSDGSVLVYAELADISDLRTDASCIVTILEITGGKKIEITPGVAAEKFDINKELHGVVAADLGGLITIVGDISGDLVRMIRRLDTLAGSGTALLADGQVVKDLKTMSHEGSLLVTDARTWLTNNGGNLTSSVKELRALVADVRTAVNNNEPRLSSLLSKLEKTLAEVDATLMKTDKAIVNADTLIQRVNGVVADIKTNRGTLNAVLYDEKFKVRLDSTIHALRVLLKNADQHGVNVNVGIGHRP